VRRQAFLEAARSEFLANGYEAANVNEVVRRAGGSLATLYNQFNSKEGLFLAVMEDQHERFSREITPSCAADLPLEQGLEAMGAQILRALLTPDNLAFYRIVVGEGRKFPQLLQRYIGAGADQVLRSIADYIARAAEGRRLANPELTASIFFELLRARHHYRALSDAHYTLSDTEVAEHARTAVQVFLRGAFAEAI
jgi:AcrR family transcriptional regulator